MLNKIFSLDFAVAGSSKDAEAHTCTVNSMPESGITVIAFFHSSWTHFKIHRSSGMC